MVPPSLQAALRQYLHAKVPNIDVDMGDCEQIQGLEKLKQFHEDCIILGQDQHRCILELVQDFIDKLRWENLESGIETRDTLENGVRREIMEERLGREVTKEDVDASMKIPLSLRHEII